MVVMPSSLRLTLLGVEATDPSAAAVVTSLDLAAAPLGPLVRTQWRLATPAAADATDAEGSALALHPTIRRLTAAWAVEDGWGCGVQQVT